MQLFPSNKSELSKYVQNLHHNKRVIYSRLLFELKLKNTIKINCYSDNKSLVESSKTTHKVQDVRLQIEMQAIRQMIERDEITLECIRNEDQLSNVLTKHGASSRELLDALEWGRI